ncbi:MAG: AMP-binding protein [Cyclobacteriaceae bacterium]|nr:AMP-binding protein [Cyclobacteriaceae bacterium]
MPSSPLAQFLKWEKEIPNQIFLRQPISGQWRTWTYKQAGDEVRRIAAGIQASGLPEKSNIAILSKNCAHWPMADLAIMMCGHISVPLYATLSAHAIQQILEHSESKMVIIGKLDDYAGQQAGIPKETIRLGIDLYSIKESNTWEEWLKKYEPVHTTATWKPDDLLTIIYTSGTTGKPKGVMHTVNAFDATVRQATKELNLRIHPNLFSFLPMSHIAERVGIEMIAIYDGGTLSFAESLELFPKNLMDTQPTAFFAVPRIWGKFKEKILEKLPQKKLNTLLSIPIVKSIIQKSIKKKLGVAKAEYIVSGAAPLSPDLIHWFSKLGINILQAYGMTEDCVYAHFNRPYANRPGTVGKPLNGLTVKIAADGEIRLKSPGNTIGYYKEPELTKSLFDEEGFLRTGDMGEISADGFLTITGRTKDQFKTDKGKYIAPAPIEMKLALNTDIEQVCVVGMGVPQPMALIVLSAAGKSKSKDELITSISKSIQELNPSLESYEAIEKAVIMKDDWTIENGLMTPSMKLKRNELEKIHLPKYPRWYQLPGKVVWEN